MPAAILKPAHFLLPKYYVQGLFYGLFMHIYSNQNLARRMHEKAVLKEEKISTAY
jgi:hypothetical protein